MGSLMIVLHLLVPVVGASCLQDAIPPAQRKILMNPNGERYPVGFFQCNWAASAAANVLAATLVEEVLGYNTSLNSGQDLLKLFSFLRVSKYETTDGNPPFTVNGFCWNLSEHLLSLILLLRNTAILLCTTASPRRQSGQWNGCGILWSHWVPHPQQYLGPWMYARCELLPCPLGSLDGRICG